MTDTELLTRAVAKVIPADLAKQKLASGKKLRIYWGIDPTGARIHLGHTVPMRKLQAFADAGHHVILVIGSFTAMIGDPTDRDSIRQPLTKKQVEENFRTYKEQAKRVLDFSRIEVRYNHEWLAKLTYEEIVDHASNFTVQQMEERAMFAERMSKDKPVSVHEFLYPLMVGYDSVVLDVDCEIGGTDQEFNMLAGRTMQKAYGKREKFVLTVKLIEGTDGRKMSKTYENCVYLDDSPKDMFGKLLRIEDKLITTYFECCTDVPVHRYKEIEQLMKEGENPKIFKMELAKAIVAMYHGKREADHAAEEFERVFHSKEVPEDIPEVSVKKGTLLIDVIVDQKLAPSKSEARRLFDQGGVKLNDKVINAIDAKAEKGILKVGKRRFLKLC